MFIYIYIHPMLRADSRFWLVNRCRRISRLTSSVLDIKTKERHLWRHNGDSVFIRRFRPDWCDSWDFKAAETFQNVINIVWSWDKFVTPCLLPRIREFIHTQHRDTTRGRRYQSVASTTGYIWMHCKGPPHPNRQQTHQPGISVFSWKPAVEVPAGCLIA